MIRVKHINIRRDNHYYDAGHRKPIRTIQISNDKILPNVHWSSF